MCGSGGIIGANAVVVAAWALPHKCSMRCHRGQGHDLHGMREGGG